MGKIRTAYNSNKLVTQKHCKNNAIFQNYGSDVTMMTSSNQKKFFKNSLLRPIRMPNLMFPCFLDYELDGERAFLPPPTRVKCVGQIRDGTGLDFLDPTGEFQNHRRLTGRSTGFWPGRSTVFFTESFCSLFNVSNENFSKGGGGAWVRC